MEPTQEKKGILDVVKTAMSEMGSKKLGFTVVICGVLMTQIDYGTMPWLKGLCIAFVAGFYVLGQSLAEMGSGRHS